MADKTNHLPPTGSLGKLLRLLGPRIRPHRAKLLLAALAMVVATAMEIAAPWPIKVLSS